LGAMVLPINDVQYSSMMKGETIEDTIRTMQEYVDLIVLRHPDDDAAERAVAVASVPIINAGCGSGSHPTQAILDMYTIAKEGTRIAPHIVFFGDVEGSRTVKSLARLIERDDRCSFTYANPKNIMQHIKRADILYVVRPQRERGWMGDDYVLTPEMFAEAPNHCILMHPFPRTAELPASHDSDPRAVYFKQIEYGLYVRMAILSQMLPRV